MTLLGTNFRIFTWRMSLIKCPVFVVVLTILSTFNRGDAEVMCVITESCILPCSFQPGNEAVIHWILMINNAPVHSYYHNQDQLLSQNPRYKGRTSLFKDQISSGNASLLLNRAEVQDKGKYKCYTSTITGNKVSFIDIDVEAPVREVSVQKVENIITCSSEGIYPTPKLTWSTNPPSNVTVLNETTVRTEQQIYDIKSSLMLSDNISLDYTCTISNGRRGRTASWYKPTSMKGSKSEATIPCTATVPPRTRLVWTFNQSQIILNQTGDSPYTASEEWVKLVKDVSESGALILQDLSSDHDGMYTCEQSNDEQTLITNTVLRIENSPGHTAAVTVTSTVGVILSLIIIVIILVVLFKYRESIRKKCCKTQNGGTSYSRANGEDCPKQQEDLVWGNEEMLQT